MSEPLKNDRYIEIDCPPGATRPGDLFPGVIKDTGLEETDFKCVSKFFGNWVFALKNDAKAETFEAVRRTTIKERITALYKQGWIRYGSW